MTQVGIRAESLVKTYPLSSRQRKASGTGERRKLAVNGLGFEARAGEVFGILGPNGAGKTTTLRMLSTLIRPDSGDAWVCGHSIVSEPVEVRRRIGFLTSELRLEESFTPSYLFDFFSRLHGVDRAVAESRRSDLFARFGIEPYAETKIADLSTGMKQKASLVTSIAHDPDVVIFDEPTNGLDLVGARVVTDFISELRERGKTVLLSTHIFSLAESACDRVGIVIGGEMAACDTLGALTAGASLEDVFFGLYDAAGEEVRDA